MPDHPITARPPLGTFAIGFGLAGLAEAWQIAAGPLSLPGWLPQIFWMVAAITWLALLTAHAVRGHAAHQPLIEQLRHPVQGPLAALVPVTGMLIGADLIRGVGWAGRLLVGVSMAALVVFAGWQIATWLQGRLTLEALHGGYLLPTVAGGLVAADAAEAAGWPLLGWGMFGIGMFCWIAITTLLVLRLMVRPALPGPLVPTMAVLVAPPAVAGLAWFALAGHRADPVSAALGAIGVLLVLVQVGLLPRYRRLTFSLGFWSFTFPAAAVAADALAWLDLRDFAGRVVIAALILGGVTVLIGTICVRSLSLGRKHRDESTRSGEDRRSAATA